MQKAIALDSKSGDSLWADATWKEMEKVRVTLKILPNKTRALIGHQFVECDMVFDIKMEDFKWKAWLVTEGYMTKAPETITYVRVVSRETVRIALMIAAFNDLEVK